MRSFAVVCPGQGAQAPDMFDAVESHPRGRAVLEDFHAALGRDLATEARSGADLRPNAWAQPALVALARATWEVLGPELPTPAAFAGYSVGELSAWSCAGAWDAGTTARVAATRARLMDEADPGGCGILAVRGVPLPALGEAIAELGAHVAIVNDERDHAVLAGPREALARAEDRLRARGATLRRLEVPVPSHTPLLAPAAQRFAGVLAELPARAPTAPVLRGLDGRRSLDARSGLAALARAIAEPVRWSDCMRELTESGVRVALELGPGRTLARLIGESQPEIVVRSVADFRSWHGVVEWVQARLRD
jgi:[acyl-carrier-protein] S-malonyltransferase